MSSGTTRDLYGVWGTGPSNVYAVGASGTIRRYNGTTWSYVSSGTSYTLRAVCGSGATSIFAVGRQADARCLVGAGGACRRFHARP